MSKFDPLRFIADHAGMALVDAISEAYRQGQQDAQHVPNTNDGDTISRQAAIDVFEDTTFTKNEIRRRLSELPSAQPQRWIPCKERMPYIDGEYLITKKCFGWNCKKYYKPDIAWYGKKSGWHKADEVIAWCELPEPYKEDPCNGCVYLGESCVGEGCWKLTERKEGADG